MAEGKENIDPTFAAVPSILHDLRQNRIPFRNLRPAEYQENERELSPERMMHLIDFFIFGEENHDAENVDGQDSDDEGGAENNVEPVLEEVENEELNEEPVENEGDVFWRNLLDEIFERLGEYQVGEDFVMFGDEEVGEED